MEEGLTGQYGVFDIGAFENDIDDEDDDDVGKFVVPRFRKTRKSIYR